MIDRGAKVTVTRQAKLLALSRSSVYYSPRALSDRDLRMMRRIDELHLQWPFYGSRKLTWELQKEGHKVGRRHVVTLMRRMGMEAIYRRPRTSIPAREASIRPYLLGNLSINRSNQVWASDISYLPMAHGFLYLVAILDVASRKVLAFRLSNTLTTDFCVEALEEALAKSARLRYLTLTKDRNLPATSGSRYSTTPALPSAWTAKVAGSTTCLSSGFGAASNTKKSICTGTKTGPKRVPRSLDTSAFTTHDALIRPCNTKRPMRCISTASRLRRRWQRSDDIEPESPELLSPAA
jgi:putative transposase